MMAPKFEEISRLKLEIEEKNGDSEENEKVEVELMTDSILAIDSIREIKLKPNDKVEVKISRWPLLRVR